MENGAASNLSTFHFLTPDLVINLAERALGQRLQNLCWPLASYINRVYELKLENGDSIVAKFYRPGRWSKAALDDEHMFLKELYEDELSVVPPITLPDGSTLAEYEGTYFALFPRKAGRALEEPTYDQWEQLGRLLARVHAIGARHPATERITIHPHLSTRANIQTILSLTPPPPDLARQYEQAAHAIVEQIAPMFEGVEKIRIHGDCHRTNIVSRPGDAMYIIDFDDMAMGPPVQDLWMTLPGHASESRVELELFLEGYETFRSFDKKSLRLIEPLRAMRYIHFTAWCAVQVADGGFTRIAPDWGSEDFWRRGIRDLEMQKDEIRASANNDPLGLPSV